jgi:GTP-binding protein
MLIDTVTLVVLSGRGGDGAATFARNARTAHGGPDGGNGGNGGSVFVKGSDNVTDLRQFRFQKKIEAESGINGQNNKKYGHNALDTTIYVPVGTKITDVDTDTSFEINDTTTPYLIARGGKGGRGNVTFKNSINQAPTQYEKGGELQEKHLLFELRLIASVGLVGLPNAGKSSLLSVLTAAKPKIAAYPFTTLEPNIGMMGSTAIADIPGLIEGASEGKGLGVHFLRHIEKTKILLHMIDVTSSDPIKDYEIVRQEFKAHNPKLLERKEIIVLNKIDLAQPEEIKKVQKLFKSLKKTVTTSSIYDTDSIVKLKKLIEKELSSKAT